MTRGELPKTLPFIHREAVKALKASSSFTDPASGEVSQVLRAFYATGPQAAGAAAADVEQAAQGIQELYRRNVFPEMKVTFGTYPSHIGHVDSPGCFRCHDDNHLASDGKKIAQECDTCHAIE